MCEYCGRSICPSGCPNAEVKVVCLCANCGHEIYENEECYDFDGEMWCEDCVRDCHTYAKGGDD